MIRSLSVAAVLFVFCTHLTATELDQGEHTVELNGIKHWYKVSGKGPICVMPSPAWGCSSDLYFRTLRPLEEYFTIVYLDSRGCGRSAKPTSTKEYTWDYLVADLEAMRVYIKQDKMWLMGHSEGGIEAIHYACKHPEHVSGLVLFGASAAISPKDDTETIARIAKRKDEPWFAESAKLIAAGQPKQDAEMKATMAKLLPAYWANPERIAKFQADFDSNTMSAVAYTAQMDSNRLHFDIGAELTKVNAPALIVVGDRDCSCPLYMSEKLHLGLNQSKLMVIEDSGHFPWLEQADAFKEMLPGYMKAIGVRR